MAQHQQIIQQVQQHLAAARYDQAKALLQRALQKGAGPDLDNAMAVTLAQQGAADQAEFYAARALAAAPGAASIAVTLGNILSMAGKHERALKVFGQALRIDPGHPGARLGEANSFRAVNRLTEAERSLRGALGERRDAAVEATLAATICWMGRPTEATALARAAAGQFPHDETVATTWANVSNYDPDLSPAEVRAAHENYGRVAASIISTQPAPPPYPQTPARPLRVGFLSPDLRQHSVAYFLLPILEHLPAHGFESACYAVHLKGDAMSDRLRARARVWREVAKNSDDEIARLVRSDKVDILIDLAGHTLGHRLGVLQRRPAPVQATYLGYPNITGLATIDARLVDANTDPPEPGEAAGPERLVRIEPPFICYSPSPDAPPAERAPGGGIVFGSFNGVPKIHGGVLAAWAKILSRVPGSTLLLKSSQFGDPFLRGAYVERLGALGVAADRVRIHEGTKGMREHLEMYSRMDIALDSFPYHGTTTTCEALWQGVPVVTLAGDRHAARVGVSLLRSVGIPELIARSEEEYIALAVALAGDAGRLAAYRRELRGKMASSPLCDGPGFAARFAAALRTIASE